MAESDYAHWDPERREFGYYAEDGKVWIPMDTPRREWGPGS